MDKAKQQQRQEQAAARKNNSEDACLWFCGYMRMRVCVSLVLKLKA